VTDGLDAVAARVSAGPRAGAVADLTRHSTRLHGLVAFPALFAIVILTDPVLRLWLGDQIARRFDEPERAIAQAVLLIQILSVGIGIRSITDSWTRILYDMARSS
jgi:O-antigen/teichoic acid export membrane protein